ncbi:hypothetical protein ACPZ19_43305 [Amycolatopsis lurida]
MVSFLEELRGEPGSVSTPAGEHDGASRGANSVADDYGSTSETDTSEWSGGAKQNYVATATKLVDGMRSRSRRRPARRR